MVIADVAKPLGVQLYDHIIVGKDGHASLKGLRLIYALNLPLIVRCSYARGRALSPSRPPAFLPTASSAQAKLVAFRARSW
jgi:hypothetical protein